MKAIKSCDYVLFVSFVVWSVFEDNLLQGIIVFLVFRALRSFLAYVMLNIVKIALPCYEFEDKGLVWIYIYIKVFSTLFIDISMTRIKVFILQIISYTLIICRINTFFQ